MFSGFTGVYRLVYFYRYLRFYLFIRGGYAARSAISTGNDLIREAGGGVVAVAIQYRLGLFGFLPGQKVKDGGALNVGLCKYLGSKKTRDGDSPFTQYSLLYSGSAGSITMGAETCQSTVKLTCRL